MSCKVGETLRGNSSEYSVLKIVGEGSFGQVTECLNVVTKEKVAVKFLKGHPDVSKIAEREVMTLQFLSEMNPDRINVVKFLESFQHEGLPCLVFERLQMNLFDLINEGRPMCLNGIRPIAQQLLVALDALQKVDMIHRDIKPDNIMLVSLDLPVRVKLIDFGLACHPSDLRCGQVIQTLRHRAPEVYLGLPLTAAIDVWAVGCVLGFLYLAINLFQGKSEYEVFKFMVTFLGQPEDHLLRAGKYTNKFFSVVSTGEEEGEAEGHQTWRLLTPEEYNNRNNLEAKSKREEELPDSLDILHKLYPVEDGAAEDEDRLVFVDLLKRLLHLDGAQRTTPSLALTHPFITMSHLDKHSDNKDYLSNTRKMMGISSTPDKESSSESHQDVDVAASTDSERNSGDKNKNDNPTEETPAGPTEETLDGLIEETPDGLTEETPDGLTEETLDGLTEETPAGPTEETLDGLIEETPDGPTEETPDGLTEETPDDGPTEETPDGLTEETPDDGLTEETPDGLTEETPGGLIEETPDGAPGKYTIKEFKDYLLKDYSEEEYVSEEESVSEEEAEQPPEEAEQPPEEAEQPPEELEQPPPRPSASSRRGNKVMKRIRSFFRRLKKAFCCCCQVEDD